MKGGFVLGSWDPGSIYGVQYWDPENVFHLKPSLTEGAGEDTEHAKTRGLIVERLADVAKKQDVIDAKDETIKILKDQLRDLEERLGAITEKLVKAEQLEAATSRMCEEVKLRSAETCMQMSEQLTDLRKYLSKFAPHRRFFKVTFGFLLFFSVAVFVNSVFGVRIIEPFWGAIGIPLTAAMLVVIYFGMTDAEESAHDVEKH